MTPRFLALVAAIAMLPASAHASASDQEDGSAELDLGAVPDAFGQTVGSETTGLYTASEIRGFDPVDAGNARIEGLYFDRVGSISARSLQSSTIRVGFGALGYAFPAPTGLVDYALIRPDDTLSATLELVSDLGAQSGGSLEVSAPVAEGIALFAGLGLFGRSNPHGNKAFLANYGSLLEWKNGRGAEVMVLFNGQRRTGDEARPRLFAAGPDLPPKMKRGRDLTQPWTDEAYEMGTSGVIAQIPLGTMRLEAGVFRSVRQDDAKFTDNLNGVTADGVVTSRTIIASADIHEASNSGELRLVRPLGSRHQLTLSLRARDKRRRYGGSQSVTFGSSALDERLIYDEPDFAFGQQNRDHVRQVMYGAGYSGSPFDALTIDAGVMRSDYRKRLDFASEGVDDALSREEPTLWNVAAAYALAPSISVFASAIRGMEEASAAPGRATNQYEAPPAIRTRQQEFGLRFAPVEDLSLMVGAFEIAKPYYNLDPYLEFRELGTLTLSGMELSLRASPSPEITLLGGAMLAKPVTSGEAVDLGLIGSRPIATAGTRAVTNVDWRPDGGTSDWSLDAALNYVGERAADSQNALVVPANTTFDFGFRYRFAVAGKDWLLRGKAENLFDAYGWNVSQSGALTYTDPRTISLRLAMPL